MLTFNPCIQFTGAKRLSLALILSLLITPAYSALADSVDADPQTISSELSLNSTSGMTSTYLKPGVDFGNYNALQIEDASVEFKTHWLRNYNRGRHSIFNRLNEKDVAAIKDRFAVNFKKTFTRFMTEKAGYTLLSTSADTHTGKTLLIKPSIINLNINGPSKATPDLNHTMVYRAGSATLALEIYDADSGQLIGKIIDKKRTRRYHDLFRANRVTNNFEFRSVYQNWAKSLQSALQ